MDVDQILKGSLDYEDGETGVDRCIDLFCDQQGVSDQLRERAKWEAFKRGALGAGIPLSVIEGKTKLCDHFSPDYIRFQTSGGRE